ncbi:hypothetical protein OKC48_06780 [Methylorubrum extorquens]|uniref:hypothetical protein n=1 Tax=Methylorubrum extorquens TaxID=408 RepID=UPI0022379833|nr:hypothetical protein [Methylorubrum extorquens]UYW28219.1 hypothetical protein OKC48_06780 [Methylorubrum extorquens]
MQDEDWVAGRSETANEASERVLTDARIATDSWGFYAWGDGPGGIGGGVGAFYWFPDLVALREFLVAHGAFLFPVSGRKDMRAVDAAVKDIANHLSDGAAVEGVLGRLNVELKGEAQFDWIGRYGDLLGAAGEFPLRLRSQFRGGTSGDRPIGSDEHVAFGEFLETYGV